MKKEFIEKTKIFSSDYLKCCKYIIDADHMGFTKKFYSKMISNSVLLEDFLDFHGAKNNSRWFFYRELSAAVRYISLSGYAQRHILKRLDFYYLKDADKFREYGEKAEIFLIDCLKNLAPVIIKEAESLKITFYDDYIYTQKDFIVIPTDYRLEYNIKDKNRSQQKKNIVKIANEFLFIADYFNELEFFEPLGIEKINEIVPLKINEVEMRRFEVLVHNLQSSFDTYVIQEGSHVKETDFKRFRGSLSVSLHLLQNISRLLHLYERHIYKVGYKKIYKDVRQKLASLINVERILDIIINYGFYYICFFFSDSRKLAADLLNDNIERASVKVSVPEKGFHSRPSLLVSKIVKYYGGEVELCVGEDRFNAASIVDIQWAGGKIQKEGIKNVVFQGDKRALEDIKILASVGYGEEIMGKTKFLPKELLYLKES